jgi:hypothetical protein
VHSNDEFREDESAALLGISKLPYPSESLVGQARFLEDLLCLVSRKLVPSLEGLALE